MDEITVEKLLRIEPTLTQNQAETLAAFLADEQDAWTATVMPIVRTSDAERFSVTKIDTKGAYA